MDYNKIYAYIVIFETNRIYILQELCNIISFNILICITCTIKIKKIRILYPYDWFVRDFVIKYSNSINILCIKYVLELMQKYMLYIFLSYPRHDCKIISPILSKLHVSCWMSHVNYTVKSDCVVYKCESNPLIFVRTT